MTKPEITREDVGKVARALITLNKHTTTLDVKMALRNLGFFATQDRVRELMLDITTKDGDVDYVDSGLGYRVYQFRDSVKLVLDGWPNPIKSTDDDDDLDSPLITHRDYRLADYLVADIFGGYARNYSQVTRTQAKAMWARDTGMEYRFARTRKAL